MATTQARKTTGKKSAAKKTATKKTVKKAAATHPRPSVTRVVSATVAPHSGRLRAPPVARNLQVNGDRVGPGRRAGP